MIIIVIRTIIVIVIIVAIVTIITIKAIIHLSKNVLGIKCKKLVSE